MKNKSTWYFVLIAIIIIVVTINTNHFNNEKNKEWQLTKENTSGKLMCWIV